MRYFAIALTTILVACASSPLEWPEVSPNFAKLDEGRLLIYKRIELAKPVEAENALQSVLLTAVSNAHEEALDQWRGSNSVKSSLKNVGLIDHANAVVIYDVTTRSNGGFTADKGSLYVYALARKAGVWKIIAKYQLTQRQVVA